MRVIVTGALGYIGSAVAVELRDHHRVIAIDNDRPGHANGLSGVDHWDVDIRRGLPREIVKRADAVIHLAAIPGIDRCATEPALAAAVNVEATARIARQCARRGVPLIFGSTIGVYDAMIDVIDGTQPRHAPTFYGQTKRAGEDVIGAIARENMPALAFQMGNLYGSHVVDGEAVSKPTVVNYFIRQARRGETLTVHEPGIQTRDFINVHDVARAYRTAAELAPYWPNGMLTLPLASGELYAVEEVAEWAAEAADTTFEYVEHPGEPRWVQQVDISRTVTLGWEPTFDVREYVEREVARVAP